MPKTRLGRYSFRLLIGALLCFVIAQIVVMSGQRGGDTFFDNLWISIPMLAAGLCIIASFIIGGISIVKQHERSPFVYIACFLGVVVLFFLAGEFIFPH